MNALPRLCSLILLLACGAPVLATAQTPPARAEQRETKEAPATLARESQPKPMREEVDEAIDAIRTYSIERRKDAMERARKAAQELDQGAAELQDQLDRGWDRMSETTRTRARETMADLRQRRRDLAEWYGGMKHGSAEAWTEVKDGFVHSYHDLADALKKARAEIDRDTPAPAEKPSSEKQQEQER